MLLSRVDFIFSVLRPDGRGTSSTMMASDDLVLELNECSHLVEARSGEKMGLYPLTAVQRMVPLPKEVPGYVKQIDDVVVVHTTNPAMMVADLFTDKGHHKKLCAMCNEVEVDNDKTYCSNKCSLRYARTKKVML